MFRENVKNGTELGMLANTYMAKGDLVPDDVTIRMLLERIGRPDAEAGAMFDGFPRNVVQAAALDDALAERGAEDRPRPLHLRAGRGAHLPPRRALESAATAAPSTTSATTRRKVAGVCDKCGGELYQREDDHPEVVRNRLEKQKPPADLIEHYREAGVLREIDGQRSLDDVTASLLEAIR